MVEAEGNYNLSSFCGKYDSFHVSALQANEELKCDNNSNTSKSSEKINQQALSRNDSSTSGIASKSSDEYSVGCTIYWEKEKEDYSKLILSFILWLSCYMIMGIFGGSLAFMHFPRSDSYYAEPLPDFGYDAIPYFCPLFQIDGFMKMNVQDLVLTVLYWFILFGCLYRYLRINCNDTLEDVQEQTEKAFNFDLFSKTDDCEKVVEGPKKLITGMEVDLLTNKESGIEIQRRIIPSKSVQAHPKRILQQLFHLNSLLFITRCSLVSLTGLPQPNPRCVDVQHDEVNYPQAFAFVMLRGFPPHACGDLIYSGHVGCILICMIVLMRHNFLTPKQNIVFALTWVLALIGILSTIACRSHYTVDVILAFYFAFGLQDFYFSRSEGRVAGGSLGSFIRWMEN